MRSKWQVIDAPKSKAFHRPLRGLMRVAFVATIVMTSVTKSAFQAIAPELRFSAPLRGPETIACVTCVALGPALCQAQAAVLIESENLEPFSENS